MTPPPYSFARLASFENLWDAALRSRKGKRYKHAAALFHTRLAENLVELRDQLLAGVWRPGPYRTFEIFEPARRFISAAPYRDRVVHHALCNVIQPLFERSFVLDSYANQKGKGTHAALRRCTEYARRYSHVLQLDVRKFFPAMDHAILAARLARRIQDPRVLGLALLILESSNEQEPAVFYFPGDDLFTPYERRRGLPIGNLTSQFWANVYLDPLDHFFRDELGVPGYIRYVDDALVFANDPGQLAGWLRRARDFLDRLRLIFHPRKTRIYPVTEGIPFLGFRTFPNQRRLLPASVKRARQRLESLAKQFADSEIDREVVNRSLRAWIAHAMHGDTIGLRRTLLRSLILKAGLGQKKIFPAPRGVAGAAAPGSSSQS